ncbi:glycerol-3-phosphate dehydrogenase/oxidase [Occallatibacter riparius]|uniref:Glycerol-3-phosphate dehydrogenase n=1 Tax=Occallatibacter riparius TaxID=1002689 RepID=A0A9J7BTJ8_9BACT|nr:glycerol-3-phosphate dehydrogenase/oxidase [Occallatibacter riparius]UWZ85074.1 glycerol-3-phosphate dehydrogenase/oxidase [Occallatibacter riparius]
MNRESMLARVRERQLPNQDPWDIIVIGGGATGAGIAVDAASRGYSVLLLEREDFGKGTSSRSTKLVHGGVRYLEQGNISLVMEALKERGIMLENAPHLVHDQPFIVPNYSWWETPFYGIGLKIYDLLAGKYGFGKSRILSLEETLQRLPNIRQDGLRGGVVYHDGQFDDARLLISLIITATEQGATVLNYAPVVELTRDADGFINGVDALDRESGQRFTAAAKVVINATGIFTDETRRMADAESQPMLAPSQGIHLVFDHSFLSGDTAIMVPHTTDGRVLFAIPWHGHTLVGTTDTPIDGPSYEPAPFEQEIQFVLDTAGQYLSRPPQREDILSVFVGIRPLVKAAGSDASKTSALSRDHTIHIDATGLLTIVGGKWTTYRHMAEDVVDQAITLGRLDEAPSVTKTLRIHGYLKPEQGSGGLALPEDALAVYGTDASPIRALAESDPGLAQLLDPDLPCVGAQIVWAARNEMARTLDDVLSRRTRALLLNAAAAIRMAPAAARLLARELGHDDAWATQQVTAFLQLAAQYNVTS